MILQSYYLGGLFMDNQNINLIENENKSPKSKLLTWVATILLACAIGVFAFLKVYSGF